MDQTIVPRQRQLFFPVHYPSNQSIPGKIQTQQVRTLPKEFRKQKEPETQPCSLCLLVNLGGLRVEQTGRICSPFVMLLLDQDSFIII